jgi:hypothetical protein
MNSNIIPFNVLPDSVRESLLWDMELDYDGYESSKADTIYGILFSGNCSATNDLIINNYYKALSPKSLLDTMDVVRTTARNTQDRISELECRIVFGSARRT